MRHALQPPCHILLVAILAIATGLCVSEKLIASEVKPTSRAQWVWYPEDAAKDGAEQERFFRKTLHLPTPIKGAKIFITADDAYTLFINGKKSEPLPARNGGSSKWKYIDCHEITSLLTTGENVVAITVRNYQGMAGMILRGEINTMEGKTIPLYSNTTWKCGKTPAERWQYAGFNDSSWPSSMVIGYAGCAPWGTHGYNFSSLLDADEQFLYEEWKKNRAEQLDLSQQHLENEKAPTAKVVYRNGRAFIDVNGKDIPPFTYISVNPLFSPFWEHQAMNFAEANAPIIIMNVPPFRKFNPNNNADLLSEMDDDIKRYIKLYPNCYLIPGFFLDAPDWWLNQHPDELIGYATGSPTASGINQGRNRAASVASQEWAAYAKKLMQEIITHINQQPWSKRIIGYRFCSGINGEWHYHGMRKEMPDTGVVMTKHFRVWLGNKYQHKIAALRTAWKNDTVDFQTALIPDLKERWITGYMALRTPATDRMVLDYYECLQDTVSDAILGFAKTIKDATDHRLLVGAYYGYFFNMPYPPEGFHLNLETLLSSSSLDFLSAPYGYDRRSRDIGGDGLCRTLPELFRIYGKLHLLEDDTFTHLSKKYFSHRWSNTDPETVSLLQRQIGGAICQGYGIQYIEFSDPKDPHGWFDSPAMMSTIKQGIELYTKAGQEPTTSASQICVVVSPKNIMYFGYPSMPVDMSYNLVSGVVHELARTGAPFDIITPKEIPNPSLPNYRLYIFLNDFILTPQEKADIEKVVKRDGKTALWLYAAGAITGKGMSNESISDLTGINIKRDDEKLFQIAEIIPGTHPMTRGLQNENLKFPVATKELLITEDGPVFFVMDDNATSLAVHEKTRKTAMAIKNIVSWTSIYCAIPFVSRAVLEKCIEQAGVHRYLTTGDIVNVRPPFMMIHTKSGGDRKISLPRKAKSVTSLFDNKLLAENTSEFTCKLAPNTTLLLQIKNAQE